MILRCKPPRVLNIYAAVYGRSPDHTDTCPSHLTRPPPFGERVAALGQSAIPQKNERAGTNLIISLHLIFKSHKKTALLSLSAVSISSECLNHEAVHFVSKSCYSKQKCVVAVSNQTFQDPCFPGTRKYLSVLYSCGKPPSAAMGPNQELA